MMLELEKWFEMRKAYEHFKAKIVHYLFKQKIWLLYICAIEKIDIIARKNTMKLKN